MSDSRNITKQKYLQEAYDNLVNHSLQSFVDFQDGKIVFVSSEDQPIGGYAKEELYAMSPDEFFDLIPEEDREERKRIFNQCLVGVNLPERVEFRVIRKDGEIRWVESSPQLISYYGKPAMQTAYVDITDRKQAEEELRKLSGAVEAAPVSIVITDRNGDIEYVNPYFSFLTGYEPEEVLGKNPRILQSGSTPPETYLRLWKTILGGNIWKGELFNQKKSGELYIEAVEISPVFDKNRKITHFVAIKQDITERKRMERELRRREQEFSSLVENTTDLIARFDTNLRYVFCNAEFERRGSRPISAYIGKTILEVGGRIEESIVNLDLSARQALETGEIQQVEHNLLTVVGLRYYQTRIIPEYDDEGEIVSLLSVGRDITEHKQLEDELKEAKEFAEELATIDELTKLYNRRGFFEVCRREVGRLQRYNRAFSVLFLDIDHFKKFNDRYSYEVADQVLRLFAKTLQGSVREIDVVGRYGGEEMVIMLPEIDRKGAFHIAERLRKRIENLSVPSHQGELKVTVSIGVATLLPVDGETIPASAEDQGKILDELIAKAAEALHVAKQDGRNRVDVYIDGD